MIKIYESQIEGRNAIIEALKAGRPMNKIYIKKGERHGSIFEIINLAEKQGVPIQRLGGKAFLSIVETPGHQGVVAKVAPKKYVTVDEILQYAQKMGEPPFVIILNEIEDPQNLGSIIRTADGLGAHGVIIPKHRACGITPTVTKVSSGATEYVNVARVTNIAQTIDLLKEKGLWIVGADADGNDYFTLDLTGPLALVVGGEDKGLGRLVKRECDMLARIPLKGHISSLNAAVAAAILGYDILRQRLTKNVKKL